MVSRPLKIVLVISAAVAALIAYDTHRRDSAKRARAQQEKARQIELAAEREERQRMAWQERERQTALREQERRDAEAAMTPSERRHKALAKQFHPWDGSHMALEARIKQSMHNPRSYEHVKTQFQDLGPGRGLKVYTTWRGTNVLGAVVLNDAVAEISDTGAVLSFSINP